MTIVADDPFLPLSLIAGPAILTNACAIMMNGASVRYSLAIQQWREFRASLAAHDDRLAALYDDPGTALALAEGRIRLLLRGLNLLHGATGLFGATALLGLTGSFLARTGAGAASPTMPAVVGAGGLGLLCLLGATVAFVFESARARALLRLHLRGGERRPHQPVPA